MSLKTEAEAAKQACCELWHSIGAREWEKARALLTDDFEAFWPQSKEQIVGGDNYIEINRRYPGEHKIEVHNMMAEYDQWDLEFAVTIQVYIESKMPDGKEMKLYAISFFALESEGLIKSATEYWADTYEPPQWRKGLVQRYS